MLAPSQIAIRSSGIGSSDIPKIAGFSFWGESAHSVYLDKRGFSEPRDSSIATRMGDAMERAIEPEYLHETGVALAPLLDGNGHPLTMRHHEHPWVLASVDRVRVSDWIPVEIKFTAGDRAHYFRGDERCDACGRTRNLHWGRDPGDVPDDVAAQVQWQLLVTGAPWAHVCRFWAARGGPEFKIHTVTRCEKTIAFLLREGHRFWHQHVLAKVPPDPDSSDDSELCERQEHRSVLSGIGEAPPGTEVHVDAYLDGDRMIREGTAKKQEAANWLRRYVGSAEGLRGPNYTITNKARVDSVRVLRVKKT